MAKRSLEYEAPSNEPTAKPQHNHLLVIGIDDYQSEAIQNLRNAQDDAQALAKLLKEHYHFQGTCKELYNEQATRDNIYDALDYFLDHAGTDDNLLIYFSGHGYFRKRNEIGYWVPHDARLSRYSSLISNTTLLYDYLPKINTRHVLLIVDCCFSGALFREVNFEANKLRAHNLQQMMQGRSRLGIAAGSIELVSDGLVGNHSPFTRTLLNLLQKNQEAYLPVEDLFQPLSKMTTYQSDQRPVYGVLAKSVHEVGRQFVFQRVLEPSKLVLETDNLQVIQRAYERARKEGFAALLDFIIQYPESPLVKKARAELERLAKGNPNQKANEPLQSPKETKKQPSPTIIPPKTFDFPIPEMVLVKGGRFMMGSEKESVNERPVHEVALDDFYIGKFAVTFEEYDAYCEAVNQEKPDDRGWGRGRRPVINVSWNDAVAYCEWLSKETGQAWRLPTEAEWEYAARGGQESKDFPYAGSNDLDKVAWYRKNSGGKTHAVGQQQANELGLYDLSGNVWEWCGDWYAKDYYQTCKNQGLVNNPPGPDSGSARVLRGGSWCYYPSYCRSAFRYYVNPDLRYSFNGFRCART